MGEENFPDVISWLVLTLKSDAGTVDRSGAAQGAAQAEALRNASATSRPVDSIPWGCPKCPQA